MTPTEAQIDAALKAANETVVKFSMGPQYVTREAIVAALTTAAEVDNKKHTWDNGEPLNIAAAGSRSPYPRPCQGGEMTEPTQAQIDAAAKALKDYSGGIYPPHEYTEAAKAALTAAAEVERTAEQFSKKELEVIKDLIMEAVTNTIERCARVADDCELEGTGRQEVGRRIRALSNEG